MVSPNDDSKYAEYWDIFDNELYNKVKNTITKGTNRISADVADAVYSILVRVLDISDDFYERESFIYHHYMVDHDINEYEISSKSGIVYKFTVSNSKDRVQLCSSDYSNDEILHINNIIIKANKIIDWKIKKYADIRTII